MTAEQHVACESARQAAETAASLRRVTHSEVRDWREVRQVGICW